MAIAVKRPYNGGRAEVAPQHKINEKIRAQQVRVVGDNIENPGVFSLYEALKMADALELDLAKSAEPQLQFSVAIQAASALN